VAPGPKLYDFSTANPVLTRQFGEPAASDAAVQASSPLEATAGDRMTIGSIVGATFFLLVLVGAGATYGWANADKLWRWWWAVAIGLLVLVILTVSNPKLAPFTGII
jgi:hypothetical protein